MSAGSRRNGTTKTGPFPLPAHGWRDRADETDPSDDRPGPYTARHAAARRKTARWARKAAPAAAIAATLAAGAAAYGLAGDPQGTAAVAAALTVPAGQGTATGLAGGVGAAEARLSGTASTTAMATPTPTRRASATPSRPAPTTTARAAAATTPSATTLSCSQTGGMLPANVTAIVTFLIANGYSHNAAAGVAGNIYQESKGDPEAVGMGGGGLIGWTPLRAGMVTGDTSADLRTQLAAILTYDNEWSAYLPALNGAVTPADAAYVYVTDFERAGIPAASTREASADAIAAACNL